MNKKTVPMVDHHAMGLVPKSTVAWYDTSLQYARDMEFYRGLVTEIGEMFGDEAKTADDGSLQDSVLALKVPRLVRALLTSPAVGSAKFDELQDGDVCIVSHEQRMELFDLLKLESMCTSSNCNYKYIQWCPANVVAPMQCGDFSNEPSLPWNVFLHRAKGTAAKREKESKEKELAKPLVFGARVMVATPREKYEALWLYERADKLHAVWQEGSIAPDFIDRSTFTVIP